MTEDLKAIAGDPSEVSAAANSIRSLEDAVTLHIGHLYRNGEGDQAERMSIWLSEALEGADILDRLAEALEGQ